MLSVVLNPGLPGVRFALLRPLCGRDEVLCEEGTPGEVINLLGALLVAREEVYLQPDQVTDLPVCDLDRHAAVFRNHYFGDPVESSVRCKNCGEPFEVSFRLSDIQRSLGETHSDLKETIKGPDDTCVFQLADGRRFRLPAVQDLRAVARCEDETGVQRLRERCMIQGDPCLDPETLDAAMQAAGPILDTDLEATCPECGTSQTFRFEIQSYLGC